MVTVTLAGAFMTYLTYATRSIWPAFIAHSVHNTAWNYGDSLTQEAKSIVTYITGDTGLVLIVFYLLVFVWMINKGEKISVTNNMTVSMVKNNHKKLKVFLCFELTFIHRTQSLNLMRRLWKAYIKS
ncbi:CPBP family intramembrane metalloprotease [Bacillus luteolus]|uniref:CPBP family intramembrane metalloprotease n=1 Tax=Litchfieldia luteola TaxID=682179 RepID=A0ABR9QGJ1_9BACI|nr:CPBP family intramembrane glutamic endopeptidase [Cytobacillus luteolus]MBE4907588.1 CPBP family intramembrane metalloprotease [Cytobacillus luteolus]MBP1944363.1 hypothetical protein [Cytobacillus luteolus]